MRDLVISVGSSRYDPPRVTSTSWPKLVKRLSRFVVTDETFAEYQKAGNEKLSIKDVGWMVAGPFEPASRRKENLQYRSVLTLDLDFLTKDDVQPLIDSYFGYEFVLHSSHSHSNEAPRLRLVIPFTRDVQLDEYEPVARRIASMFDMDAYDETSFQVSRVMFLPSRSSDGDEFFYHGEGDWLDPDTLLESYVDWRDWGEWPVSSRVDRTRPPIEKAESPYDKPGIIGAFNRRYDIEEAIHAFELPYEPSGMGEGRYSYTGGSSVDGAIYYPDDGHLYSWHLSDPARGNHNAWDLVRIHRFGSYDDDPHAPISKLESQKQMLAWASELPAVRDELDNSHDFDDIEAGEKSESRLTRDNILAALRPITPGSMPYDDIQKHVTRLAAANLPEIEENVCIVMLQSKIDPRPTKEQVVKQINSTRKALLITNGDGENRDAEIELVQHVLDQYYAGGKHIRRTGGIFWTYESGKWARCGEEVVMGHIDTALLELRVTRPEVYSSLVASIVEAKTSTLANAVGSLFKRHVASFTPGEDPLKLTVRSPLPVVNCLNCELHFAQDGTFEVHDHDPEAFRTIQLDTEFDPKAKAPEWERFCKHLFRYSLEPDEMQRHLEELCGYIIQDSRWLKTWALFHGPTNTGKTTIADMLKALLGSAALEQPLQTFEGQGASQFAKLDLIGKLLLTDDDQARGVVLPDGFLKKISEEKQLRSDVKFGDPLSFIARVMPLILSNHWPAARDLSDALRERALVFQFTEQFDPAIRSDKRKSKMITNERAGVLNRFIAGLGRLRARGTWDVPFECVEAQQQWVQHSNPLYAFIDAALVVDHDAPLTTCVKSSEMYLAYTTWCMSDGIDRRHRLTKHTFFDQMFACGFDRKAVQGTYRMKGVVGFKTDPDEVTEDF